MLDFYRKVFPKRVKAKVLHKTLEEAKAEVRRLKSLLPSENYQIVEVVTYWVTNERIEKEGGKPRPI